MIPFEKRISLADFVKNHCAIHDLMHVYHSLSSYSTAKFLDMFIGVEPQDMDMKILGDTIRPPSALELSSGPEGETKSLGMCHSPVYTDVIKLPPLLREFVNGNQPDKDVRDWLKSIIDHYQDWAGKKDYVTFWGDGYDQILNGCNIHKIEKGVFVFDGSEHLCITFAESPTQRFPYTLIMKQNTRKLTKLFQAYNEANIKPSTCYFVEAAPSEDALETPTPTFTMYTEEKIAPTNEADQNKVVYILAAYFPNIDQNEFWNTLEGIAKSAVTKLEYNLANASELNDAVWTQIISMGHFASPAIGSSQLKSYARWLRAQSLGWANVECSLVVTLRPCNVELRYSTLTKALPSESHLKDWDAVAWVNPTFVRMIEDDSHKGILPEFIDSLPVGLRTRLHNQAIVANHK